MARKSKIQRLQETESLLNAYQMMPGGSSFFSWEIGFLKDIINKLQRGKVLSTRQRAKTDAMIEEGPRQIPTLSPEEQNKFDIIFKNLAGEYEAQVAYDFHTKRIRGYALTEKQQGWFERMYEQANKIEAGEGWEPTEEDLARMDLIALCYQTYSNTHWYNCPKQRRAIEEILKYRGGQKPRITREQFESGQHAVRGTLKKMDNPKFSAGDSCWVRNSEWDSVQRKMITENFYGIILEGPFILPENPTQGVLYSVMADGQVVNRSVDKIYKRRA